MIPRLPRGPETGQALSSFSNDRERAAARKLPPSERLALALALRLIDAEIDAERANAPPSLLYKLRDCEHTPVGEAVQAWCIVASDVRKTAAAPDVYEDWDPDESHELRDARLATARLANTTEENPT